MSNPVKPTVKTELLPITLLITSLLTSFYFYQHFPDRVPTHWDINGDINGYSSPAFAAFFFPALNFGLYFLFLLLPYLDPKKDRYEQFAKVYHIFKGLMILFLTIIYVLIGLAGLGYKISMNVVMPLLMGSLFVIMGNYMSKIKPNWFMGIRTPWTLSDETIWRKTHQLGGKLYIIAGVLSMVSAVIPQMHAITFWIFIISIAVASIIPIIYSLALFYQKKGTTINKA